MVRSLSQRAQGSEFVFLDPDNGLEVKSKPYGRKDSSKFLYWREVEALWSSGKSLLIYQHFTREERFNFIQRMLRELRARTPASLVEAFSTPHVVFLMALQPMHQRFHAVIVDLLQKNWKGQIQHWELTRTQQDAPAVSGAFRVQPTKPVPKYAFNATRRRIRLGDGSMSKPTTTTPGYINRNRQRVVRATKLPGTDHLQRIYVMHCEICNTDYGANGSDIFQRHCPACQGGRPGLAIK
jgi:hypothetical protein